MALVVNTNLASIDTQRYLNQSQTAIDTSTQRLSSGLRINSAKDDAAGLAISTLMTAQINGMNTAVQNANNGVSLAQTAEGALQEVQNNLQRIRTLAVESANATNSASDRANLDTEAQSLLKEIQRTANQTQFNGQNILDGTFSGAVFQVGANAGNTISVQSLGNANLSALGTTNVANGTSSAAVSTVITGGSGGFPAAAAATGTLIINGTDVSSAIGAAGSASQRIGQVVDAINGAQATTGVSAYYDSTSDQIKLTSANDITVTGSDDGTLTGFDVGTDGNATAAASTGISGLNLLTYASSSLAITQIDAALTQISTTRANLGAVQNQFSSAVSSLQTNSENTSSALSTIQDTDFAAETANLTRAQILQQAGTAMLGQANTHPQQILQLLQHLAG